MSTTEDLTDSIRKLVIRGQPRLRVYEDGDEGGLRMRADHRGPGLLSALALPLLALIHPIEAVFSEVSRANKRTPAASRRVKSAPNAS